MRGAQVLRRFAATATKSAAPVRFTAARALAPAFSQQSARSTRGFASGPADQDLSDLFGAEYGDEEFVQYPSVSAKVNEKAPSFSTDAVIGDDITTVSLDDYAGKYKVLFFYPKDFTYVCPTEIIAFSDRVKEFEELGVQVMACSTDSPEAHLAWTRTPRNKGGLGDMNIPILSDLTKVVSAKYGVLLEDQGVALRGLFIIDGNDVVQQITINNLPIGRSVDETLRLVKALQFVEEHGEVCPANWTPGDKTIQSDPKNAFKYFSTLEGEEEASDENQALQAVTSRKQFDDAINSGKPVVAEFMAPWCGKCSQILPFVEQLANETPDVTFLKLDVTHPDNEDLKNELEIDVFPEFRFYKDGKPIEKPVTGYKKGPLKKTVEKLA